ncbi:MAG TPA: MarR family transcriptional regulator [Hyphomicrobiaceae bacterium]|jgi:DNA-binding MarR family transcriptional regulator|nr:MarR family transcriptional regulator [Hyphomicrobiaceae bacterium]
MVQVTLSTREAAAAKRRERERAVADGIDYGPLAEWLGFNLRMAQTASFQAFARESEDVDLRPGRFAVLTLIGRNPGISQTALSRANCRDKSTLTPVLNDLTRRGLINRTRVKKDQRSYQLTLTPAGEAMLRRLTACAERHERELDRIVGPRDRARFLHLLKKLRSELSAGVAAGQDPTG